MTRLFGPSREEVWRELGRQLGAQYVDGGFWKGDKVEAVHGPWIVTLDTHTVSHGHAHTTYTRLRAPYMNPEGFRFTVYRRNVFTGVATWLGMQDVAVGHEAFDREFVVKGTHESRLRELFGSERLRDLLLAQRDVQFTVKDDEGWCGPRFPERADELSLTVRGVVKDLDRLKSLYALFSETLDQLCRMGSAYQTPPGVKL